MSTAGREGTVEGSGGTSIMHESQTLSMKQAVKKYEGI